MARPVLLRKGDRVMPYAYDNELRDDDGTVLGVFSRHWAACATMIRLSDPAFRSMDGDRPEDLAIEAQIARRPAKDEA